MRARIDWKFFLGLELTDPGFDFSVLSEFRDRLRLGGAEAILLDKLLMCCRELGLVKARGKQRTDATRVLASFEYSTGWNSLARRCGQRSIRWRQKHPTGSSV